MSVNLHFGVMDCGNIIFGRSPEDDNDDPQTFSLTSLASQNDLALKMVYYCRFIRQ